jgi:hypothetical protein
MTPPRDDRIPHAKFHAITSKWKERALRAEDVTLVNSVGTYDLWTIGWIDRRGRDA